MPDAGYGKREKGVLGDKGFGYFGPLSRPDGKVSTELSFDFESGGKKHYAPLLVPTLSYDEIQHLLKGEAPTQEIYKKAMDHALARTKAGKDVWAAPDELYPTPMKPTELPQQPPAPSVPDQSLLPQAVTPGQQ